MNAPDHREPLCGEASPGATPGDGLDAAMGKTHNAPHEGQGADSSRTVPLDAVVGRRREEERNV